MSTEHKEDLIFIIEARIQKQRLKDMKEAAKRRSIKVAGAYSTTVSHVVTEFKDIAAVLPKLGYNEIGDLGLTEVVSVEWFTDCMKAKKVVDVLDKHRIQSRVTTEPESSEIRNIAPQLMPEYACQRSTALTHHNHKITNALETLEQYAELRESSNDYSRALAFRRASCVLKCLPFPLTNIQQLHNVTNIGGHSRRVIQEILEDGVSQEVEDIIHDPWFHKMKLFTGVFGIGPSTAKKWIEKGWSSMEEAQQGCTSADWRIHWGLGFYEDLNKSVSRPETDYILDIVHRHLDQVMPGAVMELTGGFRRGKMTGHDVDILITHPREGREQGALPRLLHSLQSHDIILCGNHEASTYNNEVLTKDFKLSARGQLDHFEKWLGIIKVPKSVGQGSRDHPGTDNVTVVYRRTDGTVNSTANNGDGDNNASLKPGHISTIKTKHGKNSALDNLAHSHESSTASDNGVTTHCSNIDNNTDSVNDDLQQINGDSYGDYEASAKRQRQCTGEKTPLEMGKEPRDWLARRVDLIVAPYHQYYYALVGWTGNKQFNRDLRTYAPRELNMKLTSHGLYDFNLGRKIPAISEQQVFDNLKLTYRTPAERNC